ncbi:MAG: hypothetical protein P8X76_10775, partial [Maritimibacter sp.]
LIQARPAQNLADAGDTRIMVQFAIAKPVLSFFRMLLKIGCQDVLAIYHHAAQFQATKPPPGLADPGLNMEGRTTIQPDQSSQPGDKRQQKRQDDQDEPDIEGPFSIMAVKSAMGLR